MNEEANAMVVDTAVKLQVIAERLPIDSIIVGERVREEMGDIVDLARSIEKVGLIHSIVIDDENRLVCGGRRLKALAHLGETAVDVRRFIGLAQEQRRLMELEENSRRKDLTPYEWSKVIVEKALLARELSDGRENPEQLPVTRRESPTHRPIDPKSNEQVARAIGTSEATLRRSEVHVQTAGDYPFMQKPDWSQRQVIAAKKSLDELPESRRHVIACLIGEHGIPAEDGLMILERFSALPTEEQDHTLRLLSAGQGAARSQALTRLSGKPPMPDFRIPILTSFLSDLNRCAKGCPDDPLTPKVREIIALTRSVLAELKGEIGNGR